MGYEHGKLLADEVHATGTVFSGTELVASWRRCCERWLQGFKRPQDIEEQARLVAANACRGMRPSPTIRTQLIYSLFTSHIRVPVA
jgi:hypothetical protein